MKIMISYFYQIRNFEPNMIPVSTCCGDPDWYHLGRGEFYQYRDHRGIWNGIRWDKLSPRLIRFSDGGCFNCDHSHPESCDFMKEYEKYLKSLNFDEVMFELNKLEIWAKEYLEIKEPIIVLMCHEAFWNPCSERVKLIQWFKTNGYDLELFKGR